MTKDGALLEKYAKDENVGLSLNQFKKAMGLENNMIINSWAKLAAVLKKKTAVWKNITDGMYLDEIGEFKGKREPGEDETPKEVKKKREKKAIKSAKISADAGAGAGAGAGETTMTQSQMEKFAKDMFDDMDLTSSFSSAISPIMAPQSATSLSTTGSQFYNLSGDRSRSMSDASFANEIALEDMVNSSPFSAMVLNIVKALSPNKTKKEQLLDTLDWVQAIKDNNPARKLEFTPDKSTSSSIEELPEQPRLNVPMPSPLPDAARTGAPPSFRGNRRMSENELPSTSTFELPSTSTFELPSRSMLVFGGSSDSVAVEQPPKASESVSDMPNNPLMQQALVLLEQLVSNQQAMTQPAPPIATESPKDEKEDAVGQATTESTRQNELASNETATLEYKPNFTEVMDAANMRLATDTSRGNLGAGTSAQMQSADLWGNQFTQPPSDLPTQPELFLQTQPGGATVESSEDDAKKEDVYSFLPFAKLGGVIVWIPRHVQTAKFFFTSDDYEELTSHVKDGDPLTLDKTEEVDSTVMMSSIIKSYGTLKSFCQLGPMLPMSASVEQIYAEWLEMRQIGMAVGRYQQISGGMYENAELSMKGGIRSAVASALRPFVVAWNQMHTDAKDQIAMDMPSGKPGMGTMSGSKRKAEAGLVEPEEYNPQFSYQPVDLKRVKFSIPTV